jgi:rieske iron-sulfur protein
VKNPPRLTHQRDGGTDCCATRRSLMLGLLAGAIPGVEAAQSDPRRLPPQAGDALVIIDDAGQASPLRASTLVTDASPLPAWPASADLAVTRDRSRLNQLLVLKLDPDSLDATARRHAHDGIVVYAGVCSHATCPVSEWKAETRRLVCPCHGSEYDAAAHARVVTGPATRALPMLSIEVRDDVLRVVKPFAGKPGARAA